MRRWWAAAAVVLFCSCGEGWPGLPFIGGDGSTREEKGPGPWPVDAFKDYSADYQVGWVQSVGVDEAHNVWLLREREIGVLRPGTGEPVWTKNIGQAAQPFGRDAAAMGSTVICGGEGGRAYVGYWTYDLDQPYRHSPDDPEFRKGDLDVVRLQPDGSVALEAHLSKTTDPSGHEIGIRNSNDWHYDEDRSVLTCQRVMRGRHRGEVYIGTNHGVTRIRGVEYNAHRHPVWDVNGSLKIGYSYGLGIGQNGDVLIANEWKVAIVSPPDALEEFEDHLKAPWQLNTYAPELNSLEEMDHWRAFVQAPYDLYFLGSEKYGLWRMERTQWVGTARFSRIHGAPSNEILSLAATDDGSLFIGTGDAGLWRMKPDGSMEKMDHVKGPRVSQLIYDPTVEPSALYVLAAGRLKVLRGY